MSRVVLIDPAVFRYALGPDDPLKRPCRKVIADEDLEFVISAAGVEEVLSERALAADEQAVRKAQRVGEACRVLPLDQNVLGLALTLVERQRVSPRIAIHAATAQAHGMTEVVSPDEEFDQIEELTRLDPREMG